MRRDSISCLKEALAQAGFDCPQSYTAPAVMAERFRPTLQPGAAQTKLRFHRSMHSGSGSLWAAWLVLLIFVVSLLLIGAYLLGKKSQADSMVPCNVEARMDLFSL